MKTDHRHELKANELAEWLTNLPQWANENRSFVIFVLAAIILASLFYIWRTNSKDTATQKQLELTNLAGQLLTGKTQIIQSQEQGKDISFILLQTAESFKILADSINDNQMAAFALIKQAEALRTELHYRLGPVSAQEAATQINRAKASYTKALERLAAAEPSAAQRPNYHLLTAAAKLGLGLCEEELDNFEMAEQIYRDINANPDFEGTVTAAQAKFRLETMSDYRQKISFKPAPKPVIELTEPADTNISDINSGSISPNSASKVSNIYDANQPGK